MSDETFHGAGAASASSASATRQAPAGNTATAPSAPTGAGAPTGKMASGGGMGGIDLKYVWTEVRKRVFIKLPFSVQVAEAMEAAVPITLDEDTFVCGLPQQKFVLSSLLLSAQVRNTIESILQQAASGRRIHFQVIEGTTLEDWSLIKERQQRAQEAMIAIGEQNVGIQHIEDVLNQVVGEIRHRVTGTRDRNYPQVRARLVLDIVPLIADTAEMLFADQDTREAGRAMARTIDRIAGFLEIPPISLALEIERYQRSHGVHRDTKKEPGAAR
jgi:hypothetical protein